MVFKLDDERQARQEQAKEEKTRDQRPAVMTRLNFLRLGVLTSFGVLAQQLWRLQVQDSPDRARQQEAVRANQLRTIRTKPTRGIIYDRAMRQLVENVPIFVAGIIPGALPNDDDARTAVFDKLAGLLKMSYSVSVIPGNIPAGHENEVYNAVGLAVGWSPDAVRQFLARYTAGDFTTPDKTAANATPQTSPTPAPTPTAIPPTVDPGRPGAAENGVQVAATPTATPQAGPKVDVTKPVDIVTGISIATAQQRNIFALRPSFIPKKIADSKGTLTLNPLWQALTSDSGDPVVLIRSEVEQTYDVLRNRYQPYVMIPIKKNLSREEVMIVREKQLELPGVDVDIQPTRHYQQTDLMAHTLGFVRQINPDLLKVVNANNPDPDHPDLPMYEETDQYGQLGIEAGAEKWLRGVKGYKQVIVDAGERIVREIPETLINPQAGYNIVLTIDTDLQKRVRDILLAGLDEANKAGANINQGVAVVQNVHTGEVLAMVSHPTYDNNQWSKPVITDAEYAQMIEANVPDKDKMYPNLNRATSGVYPPGSTFKLVGAAAGLDTGVVPRNKVFKCAGALRIPYDNDPNHFNTYGCWLPSGHGDLDMVGGIKNSCDVYFYNVAVPGEGGLKYFEPTGTQPITFEGLGIARFHDYMTRFGVGQKTGIELGTVEEYAGVAPDQSWLAETYGDKAIWSAGDTLQAGIGQGYVTVTPLQMTNIVSTIANGGTLNRPTLIYKIMDADGKVVRDFAPDVKRKLDVRDDVLATIREGMHEVMQPHGTAEKHIARLKGFDMAGKTGTAEWGEAYNSKGDKHSHAWFTGYGPFDKPEVAVTVLLPFGKGEKQAEGSTFAAPIAIDIIRSYFKLPDGPPSTPTPHA